VALQLLLERRESKRLDQVVDHAAVHRGPQTLHVSRGGDGDDVDPGGAAFADRAHDLQPRDVGQVDVEEEKVRLRLCDQSQRLRSRSCLGHHAEARYLFDVGSVERRDPEIVVHDQRADHDAPTDAGFALRGSRTVNKAPPWLITVTSPPRRAATCCTSARPSPRREPGPASLVVKPSEKIWPRSLRLIPGPESCTWMTTSPSAFWIASSWRPSSMRPAIVCSRLEKSCACARSASVRLRALSSSRNRLSSSVRSRKVATYPIVRPRTTTGIRLTTSTRSAASTTSSAPVTSPISRSRTRPGGRTSVRGFPTLSPESRNSRRASSLMSVMRPSMSVAMVPSRMPCRLASRCSRSVAISPGSRPKVCR